jgi:hypothetical protein
MEEATHPWVHLDQIRQLESKDWSIRSVQIFFDRLKQISTDQNENS